MPLDSNLFVLLVRPRAGSPEWIDLVIDGTDSQHAYMAHKDPATGLLALYDPYTSALFGTLFQSPPSLPHATPNPKMRTIKLDSPPAEVVLRNTGGLSWEWSFEWDEARYVWGRDIVGLIGGERGYTLSVARRPDPNYPVFTYHPKRKGGSIEVLDFNLARVEPPIQDKKGFEIATLLALLSFTDHLFALPPSSAPSPSPAASLRAAATGASLPSLSSPSAVALASPAAPPRPPVPPVKRASSGGGKLAINEIAVIDSSEDAFAGYCERCLSLLKDPSLLYLLLFASSPQLAQTVVKLAETVKRKRYKVSGEEVPLYVDDSGEEDSRTGDNRPRKAKAYVPPTSLRIYLSRLELSELLPNYRKPKPPLPAAPCKPPIRPPIVFDSLEPPVKDAEGKGGGRLRKSSPSQTGEGGTECADAEMADTRPRRGWFGF
ncbi:hypothetical protein JCM1841_006872 [Sporobolomyces salmonicolor]